MSINKDYRRVQSAGEFELEVKKSRFIVKYSPVDSRAQSLELVEHWRHAFPDARHHCWAYCVGHPDVPLQLAMSDDGEPSGTAGMPIMNAIVGKGVGDICVVVIRYFGGTKLGAGGLIRAYGGAVNQALDRAETVIIKPKIQRNIHCDFSQEQKVRHWLSTRLGAVESVDYSCEVVMRVMLETQYESELIEFCLAHALKCEGDV